MYKGLSDLEFSNCLEVFKETKEKELSDNATNLKVKVMSGEEQLKLIQGSQTKTI